MSYISSLFVFILMLGGGGGGGDLLDVTSTDAYWRAKNITPSVEMIHAAIAQSQAADVSADIEKLGSSDFKTRQAARDALAAKGASIAEQLKKGAENKDPEIAATCKDLLLKSAGGGQEAAVRKLMAIRTLGEMKDKGSVDALKKLADSKELFVADYASRALDQIAGNAPRPRAMVKIDDDINLIPRDSGSVGQIKSGPAAMITLEKLLDTVPGIVQPKDGQKPDDARKDIIDQATTSFIPFIESTGNLRLDGMTFALSKNIGPDAGWFMLIARGQFDAAAVDAAILQAGRGGEFHAVDEDHVPTLAGRNVRIAFPSNQVAILITGANDTELDELVKATKAALAGGKGELNPDVAALLKQVDRSKEVWAVMVVPDIFKQLAPMFAGIDTLTLEAARKDGTLAFGVKGTGTDATKVQASADSTKAGVETLTKEAKDEIARMQQQAGPQQALSGYIQNIVTVLESIKVASAGNNATLNGELDPFRLVGSLMMEFGLMVQPVPQRQVQPMVDLKPPVPQPR